jgi:hypothetical protein
MIEEIRRSNANDFELTRESQKLDDEGSSCQRALITADYPDLRDGVVSGSVALWLSTRLLAVAP